MSLTSDTHTAGPATAPLSRSLLGWLADRFYTFAAGTFLAIIIDNVRYGLWRWEDPNARISMIGAPIMLVIVPLFLDHRRTVRRLKKSTLQPVE